MKPGDEVNILATSPVVVLAPSAVRRHITSVHLIAATALAAATVIITRRAWADTLVWAQDDPESGQILLAPIAFIWILWARRRLPTPAIRCSWLVGPLLVALGWASWSAGFYRAHDLLWHGGAVLMMIGAAITFLGVGTLVKFWPAFLALAFLVPVTGVGRYYISGPLQVLTAQITQDACEMVGMTVGRFGSVLRINGREVAIAEACNGLRMIWPLFLVTYLFAFVTPMRAGLRVSVLAASPLVAVAANVVRLIPTVWTYGYCEPRTAACFHEVAGWVMLVIAFVALVGFARFLKWTLPSHHSNLRAARVSTVSVGGSCHVLRACNPALTFVATVATVLLLAGASRDAWTMPTAADTRGYHLLVKEAARRIPTTIGPWVGRDVPMPDGADVVLQPNVVVSREYIDRNTGLHASVLLVQVSDARRLAPHAVTICYPCVGWEIVGSTPHDWSFGNLTLSGMEYEFWRGGFQRSAGIIVTDFLLLPNGEVVPDMGLVRQRAQRATERFHGAAHLQVVCDAAIVTDEREEMVREILTGYVPVIRIICSGVKQESHPIESKASAIAPAEASREMLPTDVLDSTGISTEEGKR